MTGQQVCPAWDVWGGYRLRCVLAAGHPGEHLASVLEPVGEQPPSVPAGSRGPVASPTTAATPPVPDTDLDIQETR